MLIKVLNINIFIGCVVPFILSVEAEHNDERIMKIGRKLRKLWLFKASLYIILWLSLAVSCTWKQPLNIYNALVQFSCSCTFTASALARASLYVCVTVNMRNQ